MLEKMEGHQILLWGEVFRFSSILECSWNREHTKGFTLTLLETRSIHEFMNIPKIECIAKIYILL